jgi:Ca2+/Na+ antiporter
MPSSTIDKAISSTKSFIETFTSSDNPTTTFTEHTITSVNNSDGIVSKLLGFISQPKFKWYILGLLLCIVAFIYFKFQNKKLDKQSEEIKSEHKEEFNIDKIDKDNNLNNTLEERDKLWINKMNEMKQQFNNQLATQADINTQLVAKLQAQQQVQAPSQAQAHQPPPPQKQSSKQPVEQLTETTSSEEIFIEEFNGKRTGSVLVIFENKDVA